MTYTRNTNDEKREQLKTWLWIAGIVVGTVVLVQVAVKYVAPHFYPFFISLISG